MLQSYLPAIVFVVLGLVVGLTFSLASRKLAPQRTPRRAQRASPYECGLPSDYQRGFRFGISFYLVGLLFILFDLEVILLVPTSIVLQDFGWHALGAIGLFIALLGVAFLYEWRRGSLDWRE